MLEEYKLTSNPSKVIHASVQGRYDFNTIHIQLLMSKGDKPPIKPFYVCSIFEKSIV
jgi:hypothetical protein